MAPPGIVIDVRKPTPELMILRVGRPAGLSFEPGQYLRLGAGRGKANKYTIASAPHEPFLEHCIELVPGGRLTPSLFALKAGHSVSLGSVSGGFVRDPSARVHLMVATVTGVAPFVSILRDAVRRGLGGQRFVLLHGASFADELVYREELTAMAAAHAEIDYIPAVSRPGDARNAGWSGATGRLPTLAPALLRDVSPDCVYACGHPGMVAAVRQLGASSGARVRTESFWKD